MNTTITEISVNQVFGVSKDLVLSYFKRQNVDGLFEESVKSDRHIIIYGSSKQGKSALVQTHIKPEESITIGCTPAMKTKDLYSSLLRQAGIEIQTTRDTVEGNDQGVTVKTGFKALIPFFGEVGSEGQIESGEKSEQTVTYTTVEFNLEIAQDISELLNKSKFKRDIILENFHYLDEAVQKVLAFDLRLFQENGLRFIILGIWREKNRLSQFNGDLIDRTIEIPVEPWNNSDFDSVIEIGSEALNITFSAEIISKIKDASFGNIGIVQELCKKTFLAAGFLNKQNVHKNLNDIKNLEKAISEKGEEYSSRHIRALESIADAGSNRGGLYMPYYLVRTIIEKDLGAEVLKDGVSRTDLHDSIKQLHYRPADVRASDMSYLLHGLSELQNKKMIIPPLFDYDRVNRRLRIIDSTLFFFLNFKDKQEILEEIPSPEDISN